jgi:hypothetical protein
LAERWAALLAVYLESARAGWWVGVMAGPWAPILAVRRAAKMVARSGVQRVAAKAARWGPP